MNIEADFEQLDIGEEPIFERNAIKQTRMNIKDNENEMFYFDRCGLEKGKFYVEQGFIFPNGASLLISNFTQKLQK